MIEGRVREALLYERQATKYSAILVKGTASSPRENQASAPPGKTSMGSFIP